jgi:hypothetical protein
LILYCVNIDKPIHKMKKTAIYLMIIIFSACLNEPQLPALSDDYILEEAIPLNFNEKISVSNDNLYLSFIKVVDESRCPESWKCLWKGEAEIELKVEKGELSKVIRLKYEGGKCTNCGNSISILGYKIKLENLSPYPNSDFYDKKLINFEDYKIVIRVAKDNEALP